MAFLLASLDTRPWTRVSEPSLSSPFIARSDGSAVSSGMDPCLRLSSLAVALVLACGAAARADADHAHARAASEVGQIVSLQAIVTRVQAEFTGSLVAVELEEDDAPWIYKVKLLTPAGAIVKLEYDARDGRLLRVKGRDAEPARRQQHDYCGDEPTRGWPPDHRTRGRRSRVAGGAAPGSMRRCRRPAWGSPWCTIWRVSTAVPSCSGAPAPGAAGGVDPPG